MVTSVFFVVSVPRQSDPAEDWEEQADTCCCQAEQDPDPDRDWHSQEHPQKAHLIMAFVNAGQAPARY